VPVSAAPIPQLQMEAGAKVLPDTSMNDNLHSALNGASPADSTSSSCGSSRRRGVPSLLASLIGLLFHAPRSDRSRTGRCRSGNAPPLSDALKRDIGLPTESFRSPAWDEIRQ
jgi:hypothetical protein